MKIAVRLDDITPDMDWKKFGIMEKMLDENHIAPLLGIVPDNQDENLKQEAAVPDFEERIRKWKEKGWVFAMHGWKHLYTTKKGGLFPLNRFSEYAGIDVEKQRKMIFDGKEKLHKIGVDTDIFMAPAHSFDKNTLSVLKEAGFRYITDGFGKVPYERKNLTFLPIAFQKKKDILRKEGYTTLVFHTNTMKEQDFAEFETILKEHKEKFISYEEYVNLPVKKRGYSEYIKEYAMATFKRILVKIYSLKR